MFNPALAGDLNATINLSFGRETFELRLQHGQLLVQRGAARQPDATLSTDLDTLRGVIFGGLPLTQARDAGLVNISGNHALIEQFVTLFPLPGMTGEAEE